jgi:hypothetical protein
MQDLNRRINNFRNFFESDSPVRVCYLINDAIQSSKNLAEKQGFDKNHVMLPIFACDKEYNLSLSLEEKKKLRGKKKFIVASYTAFANHLLKSQELKRNFYETILSDLPCNLHIDAEFHLGANKDYILKSFASFITTSNDNNNNNDNKDGIEKEIKWIEDQVFSIIKEMMIEKKYIIDGEKDLEILILESSDSKKFSRHYILKMKNHKTNQVVAFKNNLHCGAFMRQLESCIIKKFGQDLKQNPFYFWKEGEEKFEFNPSKINKDFFCDLTIYNSNRQYRTLGSIKYGEQDYENRSLKYFVYGKDINDNNNNFELSKENLFKTLVEKIDLPVQLVQCMELEGIEPTSKGNSLDSRQFRLTGEKRHFGMIDDMMNRKTSSTTSSGDFKSIAIMTIEDEKEEELVRINENSNSRSNSHNNYPSSAAYTLNNQSLSSSSLTSQNEIFKQLSELIQQDIGKKYPDVASTLKQQGLVLRENITITFSSGSKACPFIKTEHKNNHVYFVANLKNQVFYIKCKDEASCGGKMGKECKFSTSTIQKNQLFLKAQNAKFQAEKNVLEIPKIINSFYFDGILKK